jgi:methylmalonyl-CoA/ethylmalonyl-CoA epimerase
MLDSLKFHHIGFATSNLVETKSIFVKMGYVPGEDVVVPGQKVKVCFMSKAGHPLIELITPLSDDSPVTQILKRSGPGPYHFCYCVEDMEQAIKELRSEKFLLLNKPVKSNAIEDNMIVFAYRKDYGLIEIVEIFLHD